MSPLTRFLAPGARVFVPTLSGESALWAEALAAEPGRAAGVTFCGVQFPGIDRMDYLGLHPQARVEAHFMSPALRAGQAAGRVDLMALDYLGIARHFMHGPPPDLAVAQLTPPDADGWCSPGLTCDFLPLVWRRARRRVAHLNPRLPRIRSSFRVHVSELDAVEQADRPLLSWAEPAAGETEARIGAHVASLVHDGDTLQFGIGSVPVALGGALQQHRRLRIHGGLVSQSLHTLWQAGALDCDARISTGVVLGDSALHGFVGALPNLWLTDVTQTHGPPALAALAETSRFVAINAAVEVDLFGQVNAERAASVLQAGAGGLPAFAQAALAAPGGRLLICLAATARQGRLPRIVPALDARGLCTLPRSLADAVVTEHGVAELRELSVEARAQALIGIAAPAHRAALAQAWADIQRTL